MPDTTNAPQPRQQPMVDLLISIVIPSIILMKFSGPEHLGPTGGLVVALAFPVVWGLFDWFRHRHRNLMAILGVISVVLTGGIGLLKIDTRWLAVKEAAIPGLIGIGVLVAKKLGYPLIHKLLFNERIMNVARIESELAERGTQDQFERRLDRANFWLAGTFFFSAVMNFILARSIVTSESGTEAFNEELGRLTLMSYPMIAIPSMIMMLAIFWYIWKSVNTMTGLSLEEALVGAEANQDDASA